MRVSLLRDGADVTTFLPVETHGLGPFPMFAVPLGVAAAGYDAVRIEMIYSLTEPLLMGTEVLSGPAVRSVEDLPVLSLRIPGDGLWITLPAGDRPESLYLAADPGEPLFVQLLAPVGASTPRLLGPDSERPPGSGHHVLDLRTEPLSASADRVWVRPMPNLESMTISISILRSHSVAP
jgi:hypothetical protein